MAPVSTNPASNPQLAGILASVPMPASTLRPNATMVIGSDSGSFRVNVGGEQSAVPTAASGTSGQVVVGGGGTPANGAQPAAPAGALATTPVTVTPATTTTPVTETEQPAVLPSTSGFGKAERGSTMTVDMEGAGFSFPSFRSTAKTNTAPPISWGPGWTKVEKGGMWFMEHTNGMKAVPAVEYRLTPSPLGKLQTVKVANGWGKKFPDGSILVFDRKEGPYRLDPQGNKHKVALGTHTFGGVKVRIFEASVVRTLDASGNVHVFDSRGNTSLGSKRGRLAEALGSAAAGAATSGGGKTGGGDAPGKLVGGGQAMTPEALTKEVQRMTELARSITAEIRSGNVDPARLAELQAQLGTLPSGILQAAGAAGTMTSDGRALRHGDEQHGTPPMPPTPGTNDSTPGTTTGNPGTAAGGGATGTPVAGVDANATVKSLAAGATAKVDPALVTEDLRNKQARFAQLPEALQRAIATAYGSDQGAAAFKADQLVAFSASGEVRLVEGATVYTRHQAQVRGAGPGEDLALTVRPGRQPGSVGRMNASVARPAVEGGGSGSRPSTTTPSVPGVTVASTAGGGNRATTIKLFGAGGEFRSEQLGGINGSFTFRTLPAKAREAIMAFIANPNTAAGKAFASRTGSGWNIDPNAMIVIEAGYASFVNGLSMTRGTTPAPRPIVTGGGPPAPGGSAAGGGGAQPPTGGSSGGVSPVAPGTPAPVSSHGAHGGHAH